MDNLLEATARIVEIESRQDDVLRQLAELERRVAQVLAEFLPAAPQADSGAEGSPALLGSGAPPAKKAA
jgi:hypothetical protein